LSIFALVVHGTTIIVSTIAMGWSAYSKHVKCWLECSIVFVDSIALWFSIRKCLEGLEQEQDIRENTIIYFSLFGYVVFLHAIRIFHMFYVTLKPATMSTRKSTRKKSSNRLASEKEEIRSVQGILVNRKYSNMRFATKDLLPPIVGEDLSDFFSMQFYGTREKEKEDEQDDKRLSLLHLHSKQRSPFYAGRPDWNRIFVKAIARAHCSSEEGESVGVFFCGSPAIAKELQAESKIVTAQHQFAMKHLEGKVCKCKLIVHSESF